MQRCEHQLLACRPCGTAQPGINRFWPPTNRDHTGTPPFMPRPNRADRRRAGLTASAGRGRRARAAVNA